MCVNINYLSKHGVHLFAFLRDNRYKCKNSRKRYAIIINGHNIRNVHFMIVRDSLLVLTVLATQKIVLLATNTRNKNNSK